MQKKSLSRILCITVVYNYKERKKDSGKECLGEKRQKLIRILTGHMTIDSNNSVPLVRITKFFLCFFFFF